MANKDLVSEEVLQELINKLEEIVNNYCWNLEYFTPTEVEGFFDGTQQEIDYYSSLIKDDVVSKNFLHSSKQIADDIAQSILEANEYTDSLLKNISSIQLEWCETNLPTTGENNKIYILPVVSGGKTVNTLNIWNNTSNDWVSIGNLEIDITQFYNKTEIDTKMDLKANKTEVVANDKIVQTLDSTTNSSDTVLSTSGLQTEMDKKANDDEVIKKTSLVTSIDENSTDSEVPSAKAIYEKTKNMCSTSVADVPKTEITFTDETYFKNTYSDNRYSSYYVQNGICYISIYVRCVSPKPNGISHCTSDVPKPKHSIRKLITPWDVTGTQNISVFLSLDSHTKSLGFTGGQVGADYLLQFSYPVAE